MKPLPTPQGLDFRSQWLEGLGVRAWRVELQFDRPRSLDAMVAHTFRGLLGYAVLDSKGREWHDRYWAPGKAGGHRPSPVIFRSLYRTSGKETRQSAVFSIVLLGGQEIEDGLFEVLGGLQQAAVRKEPWSFGSGREKVSILGVEVVRGEHPTEWLVSDEQAATQGKARIALELITPWKPGPSKERKSGGASRLDPRRVTPGGFCAKVFRRLQNLSESYGVPDGLLPLPEEALLASVAQMTWVAECGLQPMSYRVQGSPDNGPTWYDGWEGSWVWEDCYLVVAAWLELGQIFQIRAGSGGGVYQISEVSRGGRKE